MKMKCTFVFEYPDKKTASIIQESLRLDNKDYISTTIRGNILKAEVATSSIPSLLHTINDFLACITVAEQLAIRP